MLTICPFHPGDADQALRLFQWISEIGGAKGHRLVLIADTLCSAELVTEIVHAAGKSFDSVEVLPFADHFRKWPESPNACFAMAARHVMAGPRKPWLFLEPDCVPLKAGWLDAIEREYIAAGKPFMGARVEVEGVPLHMSGNGVYPADMFRYAGYALLASEIAWDVAAAEQIVPQAHFTKLIEHSWKRDSATKQPLNVTFETWEQVEREVSNGAVLYHASKDGSLIQRLREHFANTEPRPVSTSLAVAKRVGAPEGPGRDGYKPLMRNRPARLPSPTGTLPATPFSCDILIKSYPKDYEWLSYCLRSIEKFASGFRQVVIVFPKDGMQPSAAGCTSARTIHFVPIEEHGEPYLFQQAIKMNAHDYTEADYVLHVDSDTIFTQPVTPETYFSGGKVAWLMTPWEKTETPWRPIVEKFIGEPVEYEFMRRLPLMIPRSLHVGAARFCQMKHGMPLANYILSQPNRDFSEFNCLGALAWTRARDDFHWINTEEASELPPLTVRQEFSWGGLNDTIRSEFESILSGAGEQSADAANNDPPAQPFQEGGDAPWTNAHAQSAANTARTNDSAQHLASNAAPTSEPERAADDLTRIRSLAVELQKFCTGGARTRRVREELHRLGVVELPYRNKKRRGWKKRKAKA